jgi:putative SOS response-associated peptidase YedK
VTFAVLTTAAEPELREVHDRMPLVVEPGLWGDWLDPATTGSGEVAELLDAVRGAPAGRFAAVEVSPRVGSVRSDDPTLVLPLTTS